METNFPFLALTDTSGETRSRLRGRALRGVRIPNFVGQG